ncbi:MAG: helix-turn-helix transcriptional regulator, partial [Lachnospiraceae bacterium]|nr:helix-turn-helix transcriptional regulator [Lachnospiraceae bacterium]
DSYSDTYYRRCFLCREVDAEEFVPVEYDERHKINQSKVEMQAEIDAIMDMVNDELENVHKKMKGGFAGALDYYMTEKGISEFELQQRTGITTVSISKYRNTYDPNMEKGTVLALCKGLYLLPHEAFYLLDMADIKLTNLTPSNIFVRHLITSHMDDTWAQWVEKLMMSGIAKDWIPRINSVVKDVKQDMEEENEKSL